MTIYFYTRQKKVCKKIADILEEQNNICCIYTDEGEFYKALSNMKKYPDLLLLDYLVFNHDVFNVYRYMQEIKCLVPLIFYNDPFPPEDIRVQYWIMILKLYYSDTDINTDLYTSTLNLVADAVNSDKLRPYIALMRPPLSYPEQENNTAEFLPAASPKVQDKTITFIRNELPDSLYSVFIILYKHRGKTISILELQSLLKQKDREVKIDTIYSDISRLRAFFKIHNSGGIDILKAGKGYKLLIAE
jgi:DNA-binding response OmpR family regulator